MGLPVYLLLHESSVELWAMSVRTHRLHSKQLYDSQQKLIRLTLNVLLAGNGVRSDQKVSSSAQIKDQSGIGRKWTTCSRNQKFSLHFLPLILHVWVLCCTM